MYNGPFMAVKSLKRNGRHLPGLILAKKFRFNCKFAKENYHLKDFVLVESFCRFFSFA